MKTIQEQYKEAKKLIGSTVKMVDTRPFVVTSVEVLLKGDSGSQVVEDAIEKYGFCISLHGISQSIPYYDAKVTDSNKKEEQGEPILKSILKNAEKVEEINVIKYRNGEARKEVWFTVDGKRFQWS